LNTTNDACLISIVSKEKLNGAEAFFNIYPTLNKTFVLEHFGELRLDFRAGDLDGSMSGFGCVTDSCEEIRDRIGHRHFFSSLPTGLGDTRKLTFQGHLTETDAAKIEVTKKRARTAAALTAVPFTYLKLWGALSFDNGRGFGHVLSLCLERQAQTFEKVTTFIISLGSSYDGDVHSIDARDFVILDLRKKDLLGDTHGVVSTPIKGFRGEPTKVPDPGNSDRDQTIKEELHPVAAERNLGAERHACTELEVRD
jgi:hypothetical protein